MKGRIIAVCTIIILFAVAMALDTDSQNIQALEMAMDQDPNQFELTMNEFSDIINTDDSSSVEETTKDEMSNNLNSIINSNTYTSPYKISFEKNAWFIDPFEDPVSSLDAVPIKDLDTMFTEIAASDVDLINENDLVEAFIITDMHYEESVIGSVVPY
jgi:hypothetical protein